MRGGKLQTLTSRLNYRPQRLFHPLIALGVHVVGDEVVVGLTANAFMILTIIPDRVVGAEVFKAGAAISYSQEVSGGLLEGAAMLQNPVLDADTPRPPTPSASGLRLGL